LHLVGDLFELFEEKF